MIIKSIEYSDKFREALKNHIIECYRPKEKSLKDVIIDKKALQCISELYYVNIENWLEIFEMCIDTDKVVTLRL